MRKQKKLYLKKTNNNHWWITPQIVATRYPRSWAPARISVRPLERAGFTRLIDALELNGPGRMCKVRPAREGEPAFMISDGAHCNRVHLRNRRTKKAYTKHVTWVCPYEWKRMREKMGFRANQWYTIAVPK